MKPLSQCQLYTFVDAAYLRGRDPELVARDLCRGGSDILQWRAKDATEKEILAAARRLRKVTSDFGVRFVVNDHPGIGADVGADFCHLGQEDFFDAGFSRADQVERGSAGLGLSSHAPEQALRAVSAGADYVAIGPVFATPTKPGRPGVTLEYVRWASANLSLPWFAIGGITLENLDEVLAAGARRICVVSAILNRSDISKACQEFKERLGSSTS